MTGAQLADQLANAEEAFSRSRAQFQRAQIQALFGVYYNDTEFDQTVLAYRRAAREAAAARKAWRHYWLGTHPDATAPLQPAAA